MGIICGKCSNIKVYPKQESDIIINELQSAHNEMTNQNNYNNEFSYYNESSHINVNLNIINNESSNNNNINQICRVCIIEIFGQAIGNGIFELASAMINC